MKIICKIFIGLLFLSACSKNPQELKEERADKAMQNDLHASCYLLAKKEDFMQQKGVCLAFTARDKECANFPDQKVGCNQFLLDPNYIRNKFTCERLIITNDSCQQLMLGALPKWQQIEHPQLRAWLEYLGIKQYIGWENWVSGWIPEIEIGLIYEHSHGGGPATRFLQGAELAQQEINTAGGIQGRSIRLHYAPTDSSIKDARRVAERLQSNTSIVAVIGFQSSMNSTPVAVLYERSGIVYMITAATKNDVVRHGMRMIFRLLPPQDDISQSMIHFAQQQQLNNIALLYSRDPTNEELAYALRDQAIQQRLRIVYEKSFFDSKPYFTDIAADLKEVEIDAIVIATETVNTAARLVRNLHDMGVKATLIGTGSMWSSEFVSLTQESSEGIIVPTPYNIFSRNIENVNFVENYRSKYGTSPDAVAAQAYDAVRILAHVIQNESEATVPETVAVGMRYMPEKNLAVGNYQFQLSGELVRNTTYFNQISQGEFILFKDPRTDLMHTPLNFYMIDGRMIMRPNKPGDYSGG